MALYQVVTGNTINAADLNQTINYLQQPSGGAETGYYYLNGWSNASSDTIGHGISTRSQGATPVSVSTNTSVQSPLSVYSVQTNGLTANGFHVFTNTSGASLNAYVGGTYTVQY